MRHGGGCRGEAAVRRISDEADEVGKQHQRKQLPIADKESYRWIQTFRAVQDAVPADRSLIQIGDRESKIFERCAGWAGWAAFWAVEAMGMALPLCRCAWPSRFAWRNTVVWTSATGLAFCAEVRTECRIRRYRRRARVRKGRSVDVRFKRAGGERRRPPARHRSA